MWAEELYGHALALEGAGAIGAILGKGVSGRPGA